MPLHELLLSLVIHALLYFLISMSKFSFPPLPLRPENTPVKRWLIKQYILKTYGKRWQDQTDHRRGSGCAV